MVGCVIVKNSQIIARGFHQKYGAPHAEVYALREAKSEAQGATAYITLEPCSHFGKTPPCADALIQAGISEVYIAMQDPNPLVAGRGIQKLQDAGINVNVGLLENEAKALNQVFCHYITHKTPYIVAKWAMSLDGQMITQAGDTKTLSSDKSLQDLHLLRQRLPAILIGSETARIDNPSLTARYEPVLHQPQRIVLNSKANLPKNLKLFDGSLPGKTWLICAEDAAPDYPSHTTEIIHCKTLKNQIDLPTLMQILGELQISGILVEGGRTVLNSFFQANLVNEVTTYITPWIIGNGLKKIRIPKLEDVKLNAVIKE